MVTRAAKGAVFVLTANTSVERLRELAQKYAATSRENVRTAMAKTNGQASGASTVEAKKK